MENITYATTVSAQHWAEVVDYVTDNYETDTYTLEEQRCLVAFVNSAMLAAFVAAHPQWLAH
jgi:hypothetical protein